MAEMTPLQMFWYWINERHHIYLNRQDNEQGYPWSNDKILNKYKFTNVYRQLDRVTKEYTRLVNTKAARLNPSQLLFETVMFRLFNWPPTFELFREHGLDKKWSEKKAIRLLTKKQEEKQQIFTGAYIVTNAGSTRPKIELCCEMLTLAWKRREVMLRRIADVNSLQYASTILRELPLVGGFIAYELVCDLRWSILRKATDINSWAHAGPGAIRGLNRIQNRDLKSSAPQPLALVAMQMLLTESHRKGVLGSHIDPPLEMREIEHSLCEFDKYMRVRNKQGRPRSKFTPPGAHVQPSRKKFRQFKRKV